jgi:hypothetical protein
MIKKHMSLLLHIAVLLFSSSLALVVALLPNAVALQSQVLITLFAAFVIATLPAIRFSKQLFSLPGIEDILLFFFLFLFSY